METVAVEAESPLWSHLVPAEHTVESCCGVMLRHHAIASCYRVIMYMPWGHAMESFWACDA